MAGTRLKEEPMKSALRLPRMSISKVETLIQLEKVFDLIRKAKNVITFFRDEQGEFRFLYTDLDEEEFLMLTILMNRHIEVFEFFKTAILDIENYRNNPPEHDDHFTYKALEYIKMRKQAIAYLNI